MFKKLKETTETFKSKDSKHFKCSNCNQVFLNEYPNKGKICSGIVKNPVRQCDLIRLCQTFPDGKTFKNDMSLDEASFLSTTLQIVVSQGLRFFYKRPCEVCTEQEPSCFNREKKR
jgi:hypothetical protein